MFSFRAGIVFALFSYMLAPIIIIIIVKDWCSYTYKYSNSFNIFLSLQYTHVHEDEDPIPIFGLVYYMGWSCCLLCAGDTY